jgi:hypothetical protein
MRLLKRQIDCHICSWSKNAIMFGQPEARQRIGFLRLLDYYVRRKTSLDIDEENNLKLAAMSPYARDENVQHCRHILSKVARLCNSRDSFQTPVMANEPYTSQPFGLPNEGLPLQLPISNARHQKH